MRYRPITRDQALQVLKILIEECGHRVTHNRDAECFVRAITAPRPDGGPICMEYRFCGELGFGGKFRNNGNCNNTPYVDCYRESETPARLAMIEAANRRLAELFNAGKEER